MRKAGHRLRVTGQLVDAETGAHLWADRFDGVLEDIFDLQDRVTMAVAGAIEPSVRQAEISRANRKPTENLQAYDWLLRVVGERQLYMRDILIVPWAWLAGPSNWIRAMPKPTLILRAV